MFFSKRAFNSPSSSLRCSGDKSFLLLLMSRALVAPIVVASRVSYLLLRCAPPYGVFFGLSLRSYQFAVLTRQAYVLVAGNSSGITTVTELVAAAKAKPGELSFGSPGIGTGSHVGAEKFNLAAGVKAVHVPAPPGDGIAETIAKTVAGHTTYLLAPIPLAMADIRSGKLRALGVSTNRRSLLLPEVPTIAEAGVSGFDYTIWYGVWAPAGTPQQVVDQLGKDIARAMAAPDLLDWFAKHGADPMSVTQPEFARFVLSESESAARIIKAPGMKSQ